jgi:hypothetical protein
MGGAHLSSLPPRRPQAGLAFESDRAAAFESGLRTPRTRGPHAKGPHQAIYSAAAPWNPSPEPPSRLHQRRRNPSRRRFRFSPPAPPRHQGAHPGPRKEVSNPPASRVVVFMHRSN